jgi:hypothetical protein
MPTSLAHTCRRILINVLSVEEASSKQKKKKKKKKKKSFALRKNGYQAVVAHTYNPSTPEAEAGRFLSSGLQSEF